MKAILAIIVVILLSFSVLFCFGGLFFKTPDIVIYTSMEDFRQELLEQMLKEEFPDIDISVQYIGSGNSASRIKTEGSSVEADIVMDLDYGYFNSLESGFAPLGDILDTDIYLDEFVPESKRYVPLAKFSMGVVVNTDTMAKNDLPLPTSYGDLLKPEYRNQITMPSPKASGTGYGFYKGLIDLWGKDAALDYFEKFQLNVKQFTSSGSGPVNSLVLGECSIGIAMIFQATLERNKGVPLQFLNFQEGVPYNITGMGLINGRQEKRYVKEVFRFIAEEFSMADKVNFLPEQIYKNQEPSIIKDFPDISNINMVSSSGEIKDALLNEWKWS